jgi:putative intracellular protease/amidase
MSKNILIPLPNKDFDTTEVAVPWKLWKQQGFSITFATENGEIPACDPLLLRGVIFGQLGAKKEAISFYVQDEVKSVLIDRDNFKIGNPLKPFVCVDDNLITARYPEDAYLYAQTIIQKLN